jgi:hypothetical protein
MRWYFGLSIDAERALMIDRSELMGNEKWKVKLEPTDSDITVTILYDTLIVTYSLLHNSVNTNIFFQHMT